MEMFGIFISGLLICYLIVNMILYFLFRIQMNSFLPKIKSLGENVRLTLSPFFIWGPLIKFIYKGKEISLWRGECYFFFYTKLSYPGNKIYPSTIKGSRCSALVKELASSGFDLWSSKEKLQNVLDELLQRAKEWE